MANNSRLFSRNEIHINIEERDEKETPAVGKFRHQPVLRRRSTSTNSLKSLSFDVTKLLATIRQLYLVVGSSNPSSVFSIFFPLYLYPGGRKLFVCRGGVEERSKPQGQSILRGRANGRRLDSNWLAFSEIERSIRDFFHLLLNTPTRSLILSLSLSFSLSLVFFRSLYSGFFHFVL